MNKWANEKNKWRFRSCPETFSGWKSWRKMNREMAKLILLVSFFCSLATPKWRAAEIDSGSLAPGLENIARATEICRPTLPAGLAWCDSSLGNMQFRSRHFQKHWLSEPQEFQHPEIKGREKLGVRLGGSDIATGTHMCRPHTFTRGFEIRNDECK